MPFRSLSDPVDLARAQGALEKAWAMVKQAEPGADPEKERQRLAYIVASLAELALDEDELADRAAERFRKTS